MIWRPGVTQLESLYLKGQAWVLRQGTDRRPGSDSDAAAAAAEWPGTEAAVTVM
jgi:hypothetical protein